MLIIIDILGSDPAGVWADQHDEGLLQTEDQGNGSGSNARCQN